MAATQVATQVTTKRLYNLMSGGQALMKSMYYSRQVSSSALWKKPQEVLGFLSRVGSKRWTSSMQEQGSSEDSEQLASSEAITDESPQHEIDTTTTLPNIPAATENSGKSYGTVQDDPHQVAHSTHEEWNNKEDDQERLESVGFDMSKVSRPSGGE